MRAAGLIGGAAAAMIVLTVAASARASHDRVRVMSLDQCGDQYALALAPDADLALSPRADDPDSWMRDAAAGRRRLRPTLEAAVSFRPDVVVRYWGGDARMLARLEAGGARIVNIDDATDFDGLRANIRTAAQALDAPDRGEALIRRMDGKLREARPAPAARPRSALYLSAGGFTAGQGTLIDAIFRAAGLTNAAGPGFAPVSVERIALFPPARFVLGFFDQVRGDWRGPGRHPVVRAAAKDQRVVASLPAASLTCPAWFAADAALLLKDRR